MLKCKVDEFTASLLMNDMEKIKNLDEWNDFADNVIRKIVSELRIEDIYSGTSENLSRFPAGYTKGRFIGNEGYTAIAYNEQEPRLGIVIKFSASGLSGFLKQYSRKIEQIETYELIQKLDYIAKKFDTKFSLTRLDSTADFIDMNYSVNSIYEHIRKNEWGLKDYRGASYKNKSKIEAIQINNVTLTLYLGSRKAGSESFLRIYDKKTEILNSSKTELYESAKKAENWVRLEAVSRSKRAKKITSLFLAIKDKQEYSSLILQLISDKYRFFDNSINDYADITKIMLDAIKTKKDVVMVDPTVSYDLEKSMDYFYGNFAGFQSLLYKLKKTRGEKAMNDFVQSLLDFQNNEYKPTTAILHWVAKESKDNKQYLDSLANKPKTNEKPPI